MVDISIVERPETAYVANEFFFEVEAANTSSGRRLSTVYMEVDGVIEDEDIVSLKDEGDTEILTFSHTPLHDARHTSLEIKIYTSDDEITTSLFIESCLCSGRVDEMVDSLPAPFPKQSDSNNFSLLFSAGQTLERLSEDVDRVRIATQILNAKTIPELQELAHIVNVTHKTGEELGAFRVRVLAAFNILTAEATIKELLEGAAFITGIQPDDIQYEENVQPGVIQLTFPEQILDDIPLDPEKISSILEQMVAAGYTLELVFDGTLQYTTPTNWEDGNYDPDRGKGTIEDGEVTDRGTYAGVLN